MTPSHRPLLALALFSALSLTACDAVDSEGGEPVTLTLAWDYIDVIGDCEASFPSSNTGDFVFDLDVASDLEGTSEVMNNRNSNANTGDRVPMNYEPLTFSVPADESTSIRVHFETTENDPFGPDGDMDGETGTITHAFNSGRWSPLGDQQIRLGSSSGCRVELRYSATAS